MAAGWLSRKRLTCTGHMDMPIGLRSGQGAGASTASRVEILIPATGRNASCAGDRLTGEQDASLVVLVIANSGLTPIRAADFAAPLAFAFPGREIRGAQIHGSPPGCIRGGRPGGRLPQLPSVRADPDRIELGGEFQLNRNEDLVLMVVLISKSPGVRTQIRQEGALARGRSPSGRRDRRRARAANVPAVEPVN